MNKECHIFGPVPSRRLGRSLGIDLVPFKTCTYDCIYCQLGHTTNKTMARKEWVPMEEILAELEKKLITQPDYITLSGSGEPTLYSHIGKLIDHVRSMTDIPVAVLTNGSLFWMEDVRDELACANLVIPSLDTGDAFMFNYVNRPHAEISFEQMVYGLITFRQQYHGEYWLETVLMAGYTAIQSEVSKLADNVNRIRPDKVQLNTVTRPPVEEYAVAVEDNRLHELAKLFDPPAEVIADFRGVHSLTEFNPGREDVIHMLQRRPCRLCDIAAGLGMHLNEATKFIGELITQGVLKQYRTSGESYYRHVVKE